MKKLVRDLIPEMLAQKGQPFGYYQANKEEYRSKLKEKLLEEVHEFIDILPFLKEGDSYGVQLKTN